MSEIFAIVYANLKGNLGDFAILHSMLARIHYGRRTAHYMYNSQPFVSIDGMSRCLRAVGSLRLYKDWRISRLARKASSDFGTRFSQYKAVFVAGGLHLPWSPLQVSGEE